MSDETPSLPAPTNMEPARAGEALARALEKTLTPNKPVTVADAAVASGLATRDVEAGLTWLTSEYRGNLRVTEDGDLVYLFPTGFTKPWVQKEAFDRFAERTGNALLGAGRFIVRAWLLIAMVSYALLFVALLIGLAFARQGGSSNDRDSPGLGALGGLFRMIADAFFWTFHPFSPIYIGGYYGNDYGYAAEQRGARRRGHDEDEGEKVPFYERVNRFVFGPPAPKEDPNEARARILREIRAQKGRIALADVMRVTGLPRAEADPLMARLMLDHEGDVDVSDSGGIFYTFEKLRLTAATPEEIANANANPNKNPNARPRAAWERITPLQPLTGNTAGANIGVALLNGFNLLASGWVLSQGLTIANIMALLFAARAQRGHHAAPIILPDDGTPIALGVIPFVFSIVLFALPLVRAAWRSRQKKKHRLERARLEVMREAVTHAAKKEPVDDARLRTIVRVATGEEPTSKEITKRVVELGGDVDVENQGPNGEIRYRFPELEADAEAVEEERAQANEKEARLGQVVFASDD